MCDDMVDPISDKLERYLDLLSTRQKLVAANIANIDTPGYKTRDINFSAELRNAMAGQAPVSIEPAGLTTKNDGNNVSLDREARLLSENAIRFNFASHVLKIQHRMLKSAIQEGRGA
jgi:flagellar basal-body rod protein FlgB